MVGVCIGLAGEFIYLLFGDTPLHCVYVFGVEVVELKIIESSIACDYMVIQLNFFWTSLPDALGLSLPIQTNTICTTNQNQNLIYRSTHINQETARIDFLKIYKLLQVYMYV